MVLYWPLIWVGMCLFIMMKWWPFFPAKLRMVQMFFFWNVAKMRVGKLRGWKGEEFNYGVVSEVSGWMYALARSCTPSFSFQTNVVCGWMHVLARSRTPLFSPFKLMYVRVAPWRPHLPIRQYLAIVSHFWNFSLLQSM